jgi:SAM-dependent methyltransferase
MMKFFRVLIRRLFLRENKYTAMQKIVYASGTSDHLEHNANEEYFSVLLKRITTNKSLWAGKKALDFGCGKGRNVRNLLGLADWLRVDGIDISRANIDHCKDTFEIKYSDFYTATGVDLSPLNSNYYDFVMSTIVLQHIPVYTIRKSILADVLRVMKPGGVFSFQMGFGEEMIDCAGVKMAGYYDNFYNATGTNSDCDVQISDSNAIVNDLIDLGFTNVNFKISPSFSDSKHKYWIYLECFKPTL